MKNWIILGTENRTNVSNDLKNVFVLVKCSDYSNKNNEWLIGPKNTAKSIKSFEFLQFQNYDFWLNFL